MSVSILYYKVTPEKISSAQLSELITPWSEELPEQKRLQISKLRQQNDQVLSLAGLQLLKLGMREFTDIPFSLKQLQFPQKKKPFFESKFEGKRTGKIDFNISHSGDIACCIISDNMKVGIDIELQREITAATINKYLSESKTKLRSPEEDKQQFFELWTKNEAIIKAANYGSIYTMSEITLEQDTGLYQDHCWHFYPININSDDTNKEYTCHIACSEKIADSDLKQIKPKQIYSL